VCVCRVCTHTAMETMNPSIFYFDVPSSDETTDDTDSDSYEIAIPLEKDCACPRISFELDEDVFEIM